MKLSTEKKTVSIDLIIENDKNPNQMSEFMYGQMKNTIQEKGLFGSIYVRPQAGYYQIIDGHHRFKACKELGYKELPVECSAEMTDKELAFWSIYFNNTRGKDDLEKKAAIIEQLDKGQMQLLPHTQDELNNMKELFTFNFSKYDTKQEDLANEFVKVLSVKFNSQEWEIVQKAIQDANNKGRDQKQWFMDMIKNYYIKSDISMEIVKSVLEKI